MMMVRNLREMRCSDLAFAVDCARTEGRITATVHELENFLLTDARGCWIAQIGKKLLGFSVARWYGKSGFLGAMVLHGNKRSAQLEGELLGCAVRYLEHCGSEQVCAEATQLSLPIYERAGFVKVCRILRFEGALYGRSHRHVSELRAPEFSAVAGLDRHAFRANRLSLLGQRMALAPKLCKVLQLK